MRTAIKNSGGVRGSLLIPDAPFELLVRRAISRLLTPALQCKEFVHAELLRIAAQCAPADITRFPKLQARTLPSSLWSCSAAAGISLLSLLCVLVNPQDAGRFLQATALPPAILDASFHGVGLSSCVWLDMVLQKVELCPCLCSGLESAWQALSADEHS